MKKGDAGHPASPFLLPRRISHAAARSSGAYFFWMNSIL
jgi:hypothetical protein